MYRWLLAGLLGLTFTLSASAATYRYGTPVSVTGTLGSRQGVDCCNMGKEEVVEFPAIILDHPINTIPADRQDEEGPVNGVLIMQLVMGNDAGPVQCGLHEKGVAEGYLPVRDTLQFHRSPVISGRLKFKFCFLAFLMYN